MVTADGGDAGFLKFLVFLAHPPMRARFSAPAYTMSTLRPEWPVQRPVLLHLALRRPARNIAQPWSPCFVDYALVVFRICFGHEVPIFVLPAARYFTGVVVLYDFIKQAHGAIISTVYGIQASRLRSYERKVYLWLCLVKPVFFALSDALSGAFLTHMVTS